MCDCPEIKSLAAKSDMKIIRKNMTTVFDSCSINQSSIRDFTDETLAVKSLINWTPSGEKCPIALVDDKNFYILDRNISQLSLDYPSGESSKTYQSVIKYDVACGFDEDEGESQDENDYSDDDEDDIDEDINSVANENKWRNEPRNIDHISEIYKKKKSDIEYTLAIIYPDTIKYQMFIEQIIIDEGFEICRKQILQMTPEQTSEFFNEKYGELQFPCLITYMSSSPIVVFVIAKYQAINDWLQLIGPEEVGKAKLYYPDSIRAKYGNDIQFQNAVHGSCSYAAAKKEIRFFFPDFILKPILTGDKVEQYLRNTINHILQKGIMLSCMMDSIKWKLNRCKSDENSAFLYEIGGHITINMKNVENPGVSFRQVIKSLPPVIVGHMIHQHDYWINAGALIAEHLTRKFVPRALNWIDNNADFNSLNMRYNFETHIKGYSSQSINFNDEPAILCGTSIAEWNEYPYRVEYTFLFNISSLAKKNYMWLGYLNANGYKLRDQRFKPYINAIINSQSTESLYWPYDVYKAMKSVIFLVE